MKNKLTLTALVLFSAILFASCSGSQHATCAAYDQVKVDPAK